MKIINAATPKSPSFGMNPNQAKNVANKIITSKFAKTIDFDGLNMTFPVLMGVMLGGVLVPRVIQAKDNYDRAEIIRRDTVSIATMGIGAAVLSKLFSKTSEAKSGFVLTDNASTTKNPIRRFLQNLSPEKGIQILSSEQLATKYGNINEYRDGVSGFCEFINKKGGNLGKVFSSDKATKELMTRLMGGEDILKTADNKTIMEAIKNAPKETLDAIGEMFGKATKELKDVPFAGLRKSAKQGVTTTFNNFVTKAKSMNSSFGFLSMMVIVPVFLGFMMPWINEKATKKKVAEEKAAKGGSNQPQAYKTYQNPYFMAIPGPKENNDKSVFKKIKTN